MFSPICVYYFSNPDSCPISHKLLIRAAICSDPPITCIEAAANRLAGCGRGVSGTLPIQCVGQSLGQRTSIVSPVPQHCILQLTYPVLLCPSGTSAVVPLAMRNSTTLMILLVKLTLCSPVWFVDMFCSKSTFHTATAS